MTRENLDPFKPRGVDFGEGNYKTRNHCPLAFLISWYSMFLTLSEQSVIPIELFNFVSDEVANEIEKWDGKVNEQWMFHLADETLGNMKWILGLVRPSLRWRFGNPEPTGKVLFDVGFCWGVVRNHSRKKNTNIKMLSEGLL